MNEDLHQHLMEFVYGLLDEDEANALCERITSDPLVARAYAKVKLQCDLVGRAARYEAPNLAWIRPEGFASSNASPQTASTDWSARGYRKLANWCIGVAASGLVCLVGSAFLLSSRAGRNEALPVALATSGPSQVVLTGPSRLHSEASNPFTVRVERQSGTPVSTTLNYRVYDDTGTITWQDAASTDESGVARFDVEPAIARKASHLEITAKDASSAPLRRQLETAPEQFVTYLRMDRPLYQPDDRISYRSVTLSRFGLRSDREVTTAFEIVNASDEPLEGSTNIVETEHGVASGVFQLPSDLPDGTYTLIARNPDNRFREEWRDFHVRRYEAPRLLKNLKLAQDSYTLGDQVDVDFSVKRADGGPLAELPLQIQATLDGLPLAAPQAKTDAEGKSRFSLPLPQSIEQGVASVSVTVQAGDEPAETIAKEIPINLGKVNVDFYPEGGELVAALPSRVYFYARNPLGKPAHIEGRIVNSMGEKITDVVTCHEGRGVFSLDPRANEQYRLIIEKPAGVTKEVPLPIASTDHFVTINTGGLGVFEANAPITFTLFQRAPARPLTVAAYCRGAMIGQETIDPEEYVEYTSAYSQLHRKMELPDHAQGVVRLTIFDTARTPPIPVAERLVYRRVGQKLDVTLIPDAETFAPGQPVQFDVQVRDENDAPVAAVLGISVVDEAVLNLADDKSTRMPTYFHLLTEIDSPEQLEDANFFLSDKPESVAALDSLLGTQGWRRFKDFAPTELAQAGGGGLGGGGFGMSSKDSAASSRQRSWDWFDETTLPLSTAATLNHQEGSLRLASRVARANSSSGRPLAWPIIIASIVLLVLVGVASLRAALGNRSLRAVAAIVAVASLLVGLVSLPMKPIRVVQVAGNAAPARSEFAVVLDEAEPTTADDEPVAESDVEYDAKSEGMLGKDADMIASPEFADALTADAPTEDSLLGRAMDAPREADRFVAPEKKLEAGASELALDVLQRKEKSMARPSPAAAASPAAPSPEKRQSTTEAFAHRATMRAAQPQSFEYDFNGALRNREYAKLFMDSRSSIPPAAGPSTTVIWIPLFIADPTGMATVYFNLPERASSFRAIVEAHGGDRLGAGELLIDSRDP